MRPTLPLELTKQTHQILDDIMQGVPAMLIEQRFWHIQSTDEIYLYQKLEEIG
ncbi:hypothetical protein ACNO7O_07015 [Bisgaard Taxon 45]